MKISLIITVLNEENTIESLLEAIAQQTKPADEIIITDAGSHDRTVEIIKKYKKKYTLPLQLTTVRGNRSVGRNAAIQNASYEWIAITDAGCIPDTNWLAELSNCAAKTQSDVIAGNQIGKAITPFQEAVIPYVLVMQDRIKDGSYLPATRSVLLRKKIWGEVGGFNETLDLSEDFAFFKKVQAQKYSITICKKAIVRWLPRGTYKDFVHMIYNFAVSDSRAGLIRPKIYFLFFRYLFLTGMLLSFILSRNYRILHIIILGALLYIIWAVKKNKKYVANGWYWLPLLQITADIAVITGTLRGKIMSAKAVT